MKKILGSAVALALSALLMTGCGDESKQVVRLSHSQIETHPDHIGAVAFKDTVEKKLGEV